MYTPENMQTITEADLELTDEEKQTYAVRECSQDIVESGSPIFKIVDNKEWYLVCWLSAAEAEDIEAGRSITVEFVDGKQLKMKVMQVNPQGQNRQLILSCNRYYEKFDSIRSGTCRLIKSSKSGIIVDSDSIVEEDGQKGVYVMSKQLVEASFVPVKVLLSHGDKTVVEKNYFINVEGQKVSTVENYDEILKKPPTAEEAEGSEKNAD